jgi:tocopherol cyclase
MSAIQSRNGYMLRGRKAFFGYDWWWHSLLAENPDTGELEPFFIEYYLINPALSPEKPQFGQLPANQARRIRPSYAMIKAGKWGEGKSQVHQFFPTSQCQAAANRMDVCIGDNVASDSVLKGSVRLSSTDAADHPEYMSDAGTVSWDLRVSNKVAYSAGYGSSRLFRFLQIFRMFWHVGGLMTSYSGAIQYNGKTYRVHPETCAGYQDKNWGRDYTNPWIWLNCNRFRDSAGVLQKDAAFDVGGGSPVVLGIPVGKKILVAFRYQGTLYEYNFSKIFFQKQKWACRLDDQYVYWDVETENRTSVLEAHFKCPRETMLLVNYENPKGEKNHQSLWNGGYASGFLRLYLKRNGARVPVADLTGELGGCEYGEY